jgi:hypothetical protein
MRRINQNLLLSGILVFLSLTALVTRGYEAITSLMFYVWLVSFGIGIVTLVVNVTRLLKQKRTM